MERGDIRWYRFKQTDKRRPVVILTRNSAIRFLGEVTVAPVTTTVRDSPTEVVLDKDDGMPRRCAVNCDHIQTVSKSKIGALIARIPEIKKEILKSAILFAFKLD